MLSGDWGVTPELEMEVYVHPGLKKRRKKYALTKLVCFILFSETVNYKKLLDVHEEMRCKLGMRELAQFEREVLGE